MRKIMRYESYSEQERLDDILDKLSKYGKSHLTDIENQFLDSWSSGSEKEVHDKIKWIENDQLFEDENFKFEFKELEDYGDELHIIGTMYVPDMILKNGKVIKGCLDGRIVKFQSNQTSPDFFLDGYDIFDFCSGLEYELDSFIDYVVSEIENKNINLDN